MFVNDPMKKMYVFVKKKNIVQNIRVINRITLGKQKSNLNLKFLNKKMKLTFLIS